MSIAIHGNKNDTKRHGFVVDVSAATVDNLCPVSTLRCYIDRTRHLRGDTKGPVFVSLYAPYHGLKSQAIASILNEAIKTVGLSRTEYSAKCFRPTGATLAVASGFDPATVQKIGRWKTTSVFFEHYVHSKTPSDFTDKLLKI